MENHYINDDIALHHKHYPRSLIDHLLDYRMPFINKKTARTILFIVLATLLLYSFKGRPNWLELCSGLAFFLFGIQCMNDGMQQLAGSKLNHFLMRNTATTIRGIFFGFCSTTILQSTTVVSLLTIAFINSGLITLVGGVSIIMGANLGTSSGIWLLALAGQTISLKPFAYPMIVIGVFASFNGHWSKAFGRVLLGIGFILLAVELIKVGFSSATNGIDFTGFAISGIWESLLFAGIGLLATVILQSNHATLMLVLTALGLNQIEITQAFPISIGSVLGSAITTGFVGFLNGNQNGKRLAISYIIFNATTATIAIILLPTLIWLIQKISSYSVLTPQVQLALFYTSFIFIGVSFFSLIKNNIIKLLQRIIPDEIIPIQLVTSSDESTLIAEGKIITSRYLSDTALSSTETALGAIYLEIEHLARMSVEVICLTLHIPIESLSAETIDEKEMEHYNNGPAINADSLYRQYVKGIYSDLLAFISRIQIPDDEVKYQDTLINCQVIVLNLVDSVKNSRQLQKNLSYYLQAEDSYAKDYYVQLKWYILKNLRSLHQIHQRNKDSEHYQGYSLSNIQELLAESRAFDKNLRRQIFLSVRNDQIDGFSTSSLMNDLTYASRIVDSLYHIMTLALGSHVLLDDSKEEILIHLNELEPNSG